MFPEGDQNVLPGLMMPNMTSSLPLLAPQQEQQVVQHALLTSTELFAIAKGVVNESLCKEIDAVYQFNIQNTNTPTTKTWIVNVKDSPGFVSDSPMNCIPDATFQLDEKTFQNIFYGQISPKAAYMNGSLSISGSTIVAMKLEIFINRLKST